MLKYRIRNKFIQVEMKFLKYFSVFAYLQAHEGDHDENGEPVMADKCNAEMLETGMCRGMFPQWTFDINSGKVYFSSDIFSRTIFLGQ